MIKLTWIKRHWEEKYIQMAECMVKEEVSGHFSLYQQTLTCDDALSASDGPAFQLWTA
jgi:hypothetical protein